jgi:hypothetical protein
MFKKYESLELNHDIKKLRELAEVKAEIQTLAFRLDYLESIVEDNEKLDDWIWKDSNNTFTPIPDLDDQNLKNIVENCKNKGFDIPHNISKEFLSRFGEKQTEQETVQQLTTNYNQEQELPF